MKYSLRSLMVVVTLVCVLLGGRIEYLRRMAMFHELEAARFLAVYQESHEMLPEWRAAGDAAVQHSVIARRYRLAVYRPWATVDDTPPRVLFGFDEGWWNDRGRLLQDIRNIQNGAQD